MPLRKKILNRINLITKSVGYKVVALDDPATKDADYILYEYKGQDGEFDYEKYKNIQEQGNKIKIDQIWALEDNIRFLSDYIKSSLNKVEFGICHGTRQGKEQTWFREHLNCEVIGTEISDSAKDFPYTIQWDFHEVKEEWIDNVDFIYSNSLDHSYDPEKCLNSWMKCLKSGGLCVIEHSNLDVPQISNQLDPFGAKIEIMPFLVAQWGKDKYYLKELVSAPNKHQHLKYLYFLVIQKK